MEKPHKLHAWTTILIIRPSQTPTSTSCHVKATKPCAYFNVWDFSLVGIMQRFSTQSKLNLAHMAWEHIFQAFYISFSDSYLVHEMSLQQKSNLCSSTRLSKRAKHSWWQMSLWPHMINKLAIQPQIQHNQATKTCHDQIKAFTHERVYMWHFSKA
jgi:hypothetical protein